MSDSTKTETAKESQEQETPRTEEVIPIEWEDIQEVYHYRQDIQRAESYLASLLLNHEKAKQDLLARITKAQEEIYSKAHELRRRMNVSGDHSYELKLPEQPEEKAYFVRKDS